MMISRIFQSTSRGMIIISCVFLYLTKPVYSQFNSFQFPNTSWKTSLIPGINGQFTYGTQAGAIDNNGHIYIAGQIAQNGETVVKVGKWDGLQWSLVNGYLSHVPTGIASVNSLDVDNQGNIYVAGYFNMANDSLTAVQKPVLNVAKWNSQTKTWSPIGNGINTYSIRSLKVDAQQNIFLGYTGTATAYNNTGNTQATSIIKWDENAKKWDSLSGGLLPGTGPGAYVNDIEIDGNNIFVSGQFLEASTASGTVNLQCIAKWDGSSWSSVGSFPAGITVGYGKSVALDQNGTIYFSSEDPAHLLKFDGSSWTSISNDPFQGPGDLETDRLNFLYSLHVDYSTYKYTVSQYNGSQWTKIGEVSGYPITLNGKRNISNQTMFLGGNFNKIFNPTSAQSKFAVNNVYWDGSKWNSINSLMSSDTLYTVDASNDLDIFFGGKFKDLGIHKNVNNVAALYNKQLVTLGNGVNDIVYSVEIAGDRFFDSLVFIGGQFTQAEDSGGFVVPFANHIVAWNKNTGRYLPLGQGVNGTVYKIKYVEDLYYMNSGYLFIGGEFTQATNADGSTVNVNNFVGFNLNTWRWEKWGDTDGPVKSIQADHSNLYIGGAFSKVTGTDNVGVPAENLAMYSRIQGNSKWSGLGLNINGEVLAIDIDPSVSFSPVHDVLIGGRFTQINDSVGGIQNSPYFAKLTTFFHDANNDGVGEIPYSRINNVYYHELNGAVHHITGHNAYRAVLSGEFTEVRLGDGSIRKLNHITQIRGIYDRFVFPASYNFVEWGDGTNNTVFEHTGVNECFSMGIVAAGGFSLAGSQAANSIAKWNQPGTQIVSYGVNQTSQSSLSGTSAIITTRTACQNPHQKALKKEFKTLALAKREVRGKQFQIDANTVFDLHFINYPAWNDTLASFKNLNSSNDTVVYALVGLKDTSLYAVNPEGVDRSLDLVTSYLTSSTDSSGIGIIFVNTVTDAPALDVITKENDTLVSGLKYKNQLRYIGLEAKKYTLDIKVSGSGTGLYTDTIDLSGLENKMLIYYIKGFVDPSTNQYGDSLHGGLNDFDYYIMIDSNIIHSNKRKQYITFDPIPDKTLNAPSFKLYASSSSGLPVSFERVKGNINLSGDVVSILGAGEVSIIAKQEGNDSVNKAEDVIQRFCILPDKPNITIYGNTLITDAKGSIKWYLDNELLTTENKDTLFIQQNGNYMVSSSVDGCTIQSDEIQFISTDVEDLILINDPLVYYSDNAIQIQWRGSGEIQDVAIYSISGEKMAERTNIHSSAATVNFSSEITGVYVVVIKSQQNIYTQKIIF